MRPLALAPLAFLLGCGALESEHLHFTTPPPIAPRDCAVRVIFKADDVGTAHDMTDGSGRPSAYPGRLSARWVRFFERVLASPDLRVDAGIIGRSIGLGTDTYRAQLMVLAGFDDRIAFWNHGWTHRIHDDGRCEFLHLDAAGAEAHLRWTQNAAAQLGIELTGFGAPCNDWDASTEAALAAAGIPRWYWGRPGHPGTLPASARLEVRVGTPSLARLEETWADARDPVVLQIHPNMWDDADFAEFDRAVDWLRGQGACFVTAGHL